MKIKIWCCTRDMQSEVEETVTSDYFGLTDKQILKMSKKTKKHLNKTAEQFMWEEKQPEFGFEIIEE